MEYPVKALKDVGEALDSLTGEGCHSGQSATVDEDSISARAETLRREIELIMDEERAYRAQKRPSEPSKTAHLRRQLRLAQIREELQHLREQGKRQ